MPTIDIPEKICSKCKSTRWRVNPKTGYKRCTDCTNTNQRKNHKIGSFKIKYNKNIERYRELARTRTKEYRQKNKEKLYFLVNEYLKKQRENLGNLYIKRMLTKHDKDLSFKDIPQDLIELKRKQLILIRQLKKL